MRYRQFGKTGWRVSEIGFGGARIGGLFAQDGGRATSLRTLEAACDAGINFYDTADMYSQGESEILIGKAFRKKRDKVFIATKGGYCLPAQKRLIQLIKPIAKPIVRAIGLRRSAVPAALSGTISQDFSPGHLRKAVEASLRRLQIRSYRSVPDPQPASGGTPRNPAPGCVGAPRAFEGGREDPRIWNCPRLRRRCCTLPGHGGDRQPADALRVDGPGGAGRRV